MGTPGSWSRSTGQLRGDQHTLSILVSRYRSDEMEFDHVRQPCDFVFDEIVDGEGKTC